MPIQAKTWPAPLSPSLRPPLPVLGGPGCPPPGTTAASGVGVRVGWAPAAAGIDAGVAVTVGVVVPVGIAVGALVGFAVGVGVAVGSGGPGSDPSPGGTGVGVA